MIRGEETNYQTIEIFSSRKTILSSLDAEGIREEIEEFDVHIHNIHIHTHTPIMR